MVTPIQNDTRAYPTHTGCDCSVTKQAELTHSGQIRRLKKKQPNPLKGLAELVSVVFGDLEFGGAAGIEPKPISPYAIGYLGIIAVVAFL